MKKKKKIKVKCDVIECIYHDEEEGDCTLQKIKISHENRGKNDNSSSTLCQSFEKSSGILTDNEYEVCSEIENENTK
ncbi:MAG: DUF1540 domain-containing protein [Bacilli bacterium]|nr:DUF1540 domain-containing protein [Bacilli bacterium]